jgi:hypothetical protein
VQHFFCFLQKKSVEAVEGRFWAFLWRFLRGLGKKGADVDGFFVEKLWCFCGEVVVPCVVF